MRVFLIFAACAIAGGFALRVTDPIVLMVAEDFHLAASHAALLTTCFAVPYAVAQLFLGPLGDRYGKPQCIRVCAVGLCAALLASLLVSGFTSLLATRVLAGIFAGGLIPLVLASLGDQFELKERQVMIGRMLFAIISGQMLGSILGGVLGSRLGWWGALASAAAVALITAVLAWVGLRQQVNQAVRDRSPAASALAGYRLVLRNPKALWVYACVAAEGILFFGFFPHVAALLPGAAGLEPAATAQAGLVLGAFGAGGLLYAALVRQLVTRMGVPRMCGWGSVTGAVCCVLLMSAPMAGVAAALFFASGFGFYMLHNSLQTQATELAPAARASAVALLSFSFFVGQGVGPLIFAGLLMRLGAQGALAVLVVGMLVLGRIAVRRVCPPLELEKIPAS